MKHIHVLYGEEWLPYFGTGGKGCTKNLGARTIRVVDNNGSYCRNQ